MVRFCWLVLCVWYVGSLDVTAHQGEVLDSLMKAKAMELGIYRVTAYEIRDTIYLHEITEYDKRGNKVLWAFPYGRGLQKTTYTFDDMGRTSGVVRYSTDDPGVANSWTYWEYQDSLHYSIRREHEEGIPYTVEKISIEVSGDTTWVTSVEENKRSGKEQKKSSRYIAFGDTLLQSEHIKYTPEGLLKEINAYYDLHSDSAGFITRTSGRLLVNSDVFDRLIQTEQDLMDVYEHPEKYLQRQLNGEFGYEKDGMHTWMKFDPSGNLILDGTSPALPYTVYEYNDQNVPISHRRWKRDPFERGKVICSEATTYHYTQLGLIDKLISVDQNGTEVVTYFEYEYFED